jgi:hypothetical protein
MLMSNQMSFKTKEATDMILMQFASKLSETKSFLMDKLKDDTHEISRKVKKIKTAAFD